MTTYLRDSEGKFIPASQRPDGTWRKARRIKEGYVPQEEVPLYESKGKQFANRRTDIPVGMCPLAFIENQKKKASKNKTNTTPGVLVLPENSNTKNKSQKPKAAATVTNDTNVKRPKETSKPGGSGKILSTGSDIAVAGTTNCSSYNDIDKLAKDLDNAILDEKQEKAKKMRKLKKKLNEIENIEAKIKSGELKKPEKDQLDKVKRKQQILDEINQIEIDN